MTEEPLPGRDDDIDEDSDQVRDPDDDYASGETLVLDRALEEALGRVADPEPPVERDPDSRP